MSGHRVLITGTSGLAMTRVLRKLKDAVSFDLRCCKAGKFFLECVDAKQLIDPLLPTSSEEDALIRALVLPKAVLRDCWRDAFLKLVGGGFPCIDDGPGLDKVDGTENIALAVHACYYHEESRAFVSLVDPELIKEHFGPQIVVTLIDDIENIFTRLRSEYHVYSGFDYSGFRGFALACRHLSQIVLWRALEIAFAEDLASTLGCPHVVLAVKHPVATLKTLLFNRNYPSAYLSHPISEPRRSLADGCDQEFNDFCKRLEGVASKIRRVATLFEPTTIDEFRFRRFKSPTDATVYVPQLTTRWPMPNQGNGLLWDRVDEDNPVDLQGYFSTEDIDEFEKQSTQSPQQKSRHGERTVNGKVLEVENSAHRLDILVGGIGQAVSSRDLKMVEQSRYLVVFRPLFKGRQSGGVSKEIQEYCRLANWRGNKESHICIFTSQTDEIAYRRSQIATWFWRTYGEELGVDEEKAQELARVIEINNVKEVGNPAAVLEALRSETPELLKQIDAVMVGKFQRKLIPGTKKTGDDQPLSGAPAVTRATRREKLAEELQDNLTPPYVINRPSAGEKIDFEVPIAIYWGSPWPRSQDVEECVEVITGKQKTLERIV